MDDQATMTRLFDYAQTPYQGDKCCDRVYIETKLGERSPCSSQDSDEPIDARDLVQQLNST